MENKLELKDIVGYLPYKLKVVRPDAKSILTVIGCEINGELIFNEKTATYGHLKGCKPILRPMSDLTKTITVEGYNDDKEFIPLVELMKIYNIENIDKYRIGYNINKQPYLYYGIYCFSFDSEIGIVTFNKETKDGYYSLPIRINNYKAIDFLNKLHFDYLGLIDEGLAKDKNTIKE